MSFNCELLIEDIFGLEESLNTNMKVLKDYISNFKEEYRNKYVDLLFEFYHCAYEFSSINTDTFDETDKADMNNLIQRIESFIVSYSKAVQFFTFAEVKIPYFIWSDFNNWKNKRIDLLESLE